MRPTLLIRADASPEIGMGHVIRTTSLAEAWIFGGGRALLACKQLPSTLEARVRRVGIELMILAPEEAGDPTTLVELGREQGATWVVLDGYGMGPAWHSEIREAGLRQLVFDDLAHHGSYAVDAILNPSPEAKEGLYPHRHSDTSLLLGSSFVPLASAFWDLPPLAARRASSLRILVTLGGSDPAGLTPMVIQALQELSHPWEARVVLGPLHPSTTCWQEGPRDPRITLLVDPDLPRLMGWADLAITAAGSTTWELAATGVPCLLVQVVDNQRSIANAFLEHEAAWVLRTGEITRENLVTNLEQMVVSRDECFRRATHARAFVDGRGGIRVAMHLAQRAGLPWPIFSDGDLQ